MSFSVEIFVDLLNVGDDICLLGLLGGTTVVLFESTTFESSSTLEKGGGVTGLLFRFGRPGQLASINGSDIGTDRELGGVSATTLVAVGGIGGVKFLETDLIISGDERTLVAIL